jgi:hypothetical protein
MPKIARKPEESSLYQFVHKSRVLKINALIRYAGEHGIIHLNRKLSGFGRRDVMSLSVENENNLLKFLREVGVTFPTAGMETISAAVIYSKFRHYPFLNLCALTLESEGQLYGSMHTRFYKQALNDFDLTRISTWSQKVGVTFA